MHPVFLMRRLFLLVLVALLGCVRVVAKENADEKARPVLKQAAERSLLHVDANPAFKVNFGFTLHVPKSKDVQGNAVWLVTTKGDWKVETKFSDYDDVEIGKASSVWIKRDLDFKPLQAIWVEEAFRNLQYLNVPDDVVEKYSTTSEHHVDLRCVDLRRDNKPRTLCFDSDGNLIRADVKELDIVYEYSDYRPLGQKFAPSRVVLKHKSSVILDGTIQSSLIDAPADQELLEPAGAIKRTGCLIPTLPKVAKKVVPEYPETARRAHQEGTVSIYALIGSDGAVRNPVVIRTAGKYLDASALDAVGKWQYQSAACDNVPVDYETVISINYSLQY